MSQKSRTFAKKSMSMKKFITIICLMALCVSNVRSENYKYISDSGHIFYYSVNGLGDKSVTEDEAHFLNAQDITIVMEASKKEEARNALYDSVRVLYEENKDYMWEHFPEHKYTFEEVKAFVHKHSTTMTLCDDDIVIVNLDIRFRLARYFNRKEIERDYPYILGYLYKKVKFMSDGTRCKIQSLDVPEEYVY